MPRLIHIDADSLLLDVWLNFGRNLVYRPRVSVMTGRKSLVKRSARLSSFLALATFCITQPFEPEPS